MDSMSGRDYKVSDEFVDTLFNSLYSIYLERERLLEIDAQDYQSEPDSTKKNKIEERIRLAQKDIETMITILEAHKYDENIEYIKDNLKRKIDHLIEIKNGIEGMGLI